MTAVDHAGLPAVLTDACAAAERAYATAMVSMTPTERRSKSGIGADGTETFLLDEIVEAPVLDVLARHGVNVLSEEVGWIDRGSAVALVIDPVDGTANAAAGVPLPGGDVHRIVDIAAAQLIVETAGGVVIDALGRPFDFEPDLTKRWSGIFAASAELAEDLADTIQRSQLDAAAER